MLCSLHNSAVRTEVRSSSHVVSSHIRMSAEWGPVEGDGFDADASKESSIKNISIYFTSESLYNKFVSIWEIFQQAILCVGMGLRIN